MDAFEKLLKRLEEDGIRRKPTMDEMEEAMYEDMIEDEYNKHFEEGKDYYPESRNLKILKDWKTVPSRSLAKALASSIDTINRLKKHNDPIGKDKCQINQPKSILING